MHLDELSLLRDPLPDGALDAGSPRGTLAWTQLQFACALGDEALVSTLLQEHASDKPFGTGKARDASAMDTAYTKYSYTPLHIAVHSGHTAVVKQLLAHSSTKIEAADTQIGASALHLAVMSGNTEVVRLLLDANAPHALTKNGTTPLDMAAELGHAEIRQVLADHEKKAVGREQIGNWLASIGLVEYMSSFVDAGFDDAAFLLTNGLSDAALDAMAIQKPGHRLKLQSLYQLREAVPDHVDDRSDESSSDGSEEDESSDEGSASGSDASASDSDDDEEDGSASESE